MANVLTLPFKQTQPIPGLAESLVKHICDGNPTTHPDAVTPDAQGLAKQRTKLFGDPAAPLVVAETTLVNLTAYHAQLAYALTKLPAEVPIAFSWFPIFTSSYATSTLSLGGFPSPSAVSIPNLNFERLSVLYNIAAMHSAIGAQCRRTDEEGIKASIAAFQKAAGVLTQLLDLLPLFDPEPPALSPPSPEFSTKAVEALRDICLAQAQEAFWQKGVMDRLKNGTIAKLAAKVAEYYEAAATEAVEARGLPETWPGFAFRQALLNHLNVKHLHFAAVAQFRKSIDDLGANRYGDELGRLRVAEGFVKKAIAGPRKGVADSVIRDLNGLQATLSENIARADKDNHLIYLEAVTPLSSLPAILPASMVKPLTPPQISSPLAYLHNGAGGLGKPYFESLVPQEVTLGVRVYNDRKEVWFKEEIAGRRAELEKEALSCLEALGLPGSLQAVAQPIGLPPSLLAKAQEVHEAGGGGRIRTMLEDVRRVAQVDQQILSEALAVLMQEDAEDAQHRAQYGTDRWTRPPSNAANAELMSRAETLGGMLEAAGASDALVRAKFGEAEPRLILLGSDEKTLEASIPSLAAPSLTSTQSSTLSNLRTALQALEDVRTARRRTVANARYAVDQDDVRDDVVRQAAGAPRPAAGVVPTEPATAQFEELFERRLARFGRLRREVVESASRQEDALDRIKTANTAFVQSRRNDAVLKAREEALQALEAAYHKFKELSLNLQEGLKFYSDLAGHLNELRDACKQWAYARNVEGRDQIQALAAALDGMRLKVARPGVYDPKKDGPVRFFEG